MPGRGMPSSSVLQVPLQANELVTTGTLTGAHSIQAGETWSTELEGIPLPGIFVQFVT